MRSAAGSDAIVKALSSEVRRLNEHITQLKGLVQVDTLTNVGNRRAAQDALQREVSRSSRSDLPQIAALVDCDDFKRINDTFGHACGDRVLVEVAQRIRNALRPSDHVARVGGDEFLVLLPDTRWDQAITICERLRRSIAATPIALAAGGVQMTVSVAVTQLEGVGITLERILTATHGALDESKARGKNVITAEETTEEDHSSPQASELRAVTQPMVELDSGITVGVELLSRSIRQDKRHPTRLLFAARKAGTLVAADMACLGACLRHCDHCQTLTSSKALRVHFNITSATLLSDEFSHVVNLLEPLARERRVFVELNERRLPKEPRLLRRPLKRLRQIGVGLVIDDVQLLSGTLGGLLLLEPDLVKLGRTALFGEVRKEGVERRGNGDLRRRALVRFTRMLQSIGTGAIAMGVETAKEAALVGSIGIDQAQGYFYGRPA